MEKSAATEAFWTIAKRSAAAAVGDDYWVRRLGNTQQTVDSILALVLKGQKHGTFGLKWLHDRDPALSPVLGGMAIMVDMDGTPHAIIKTTQATPVAYKDITEDHLSIEGPGARQLSRWQEIHWPYWQTLLAPHNLEPSEDMLVMVEHFDLVYPLSV
jgi:uncharacterized protein YhfF